LYYKTANCPYNISKSALLQKKTSESLFGTEEIKLGSTGTDPSAELN
jgi:hypothetical protein